MGLAAFMERAVAVDRIDGERVLSFDDLSGVLDRLEPGQRVSVRAYRNGSPNEYAVTLGEDDRGGGYVGIRGSRGISGLVLSDFGTRAYPAAEYLGLLGEGDGGTSFGPLTDSPIGRVVVALFLPVAGAFGLPENFAGFTGGVGNFFVVEGPLAPFGGGVFLLANLLFWVAWINIQLGFFNCIPAFPLDGGHILRTSTEAIVSRLPFEPRREHVRVVTTAVGLTMLLSLLVTLFGPQVL
jgi:membrane-associated protease RseP (regulator of RpoE activity)